MNGAKVHRQNRFVNSISIPAEEKMLFIEHLMMLLSAGMDMMQILQSIEKDVRSRRLKNILADMRADVEAGLPLWQALDTSQLMPRHAISLVRIGEQSGRLADNLKIIAAQQRRDREFRSRIRSAMMYPVFVLALTVVIGLGIAWFILPKLTAVFYDLGVPLPWITKALIAVGIVFQEHGAWIVPSVVIAIIIGVYILFFHKRTRVIGQWMLLLLPGVKKLVQEIEISRLGYMLGTLLDAGLPIVDALDSVAQSAGFHRYQVFYMRAAQAVNDGQSLRVFFEEYRGMRRLFPAAIEQLVVAGEQSGSLPKTLLEVGSIFEEKIANTTKNLSIILEPILLVIVWVGVVTVAFAVVLPVYSLIGGLEL